MNINNIHEGKDSGGILLIKGAKQPDGTRRLFVTVVNDVVQTKTNMSLAILGNTLFRMTKINEKITYVKINWNSTQSMLTAAGLKGKAVPLNHNKTPFYQDTLECTDFNTMLSRLKENIALLTDIKWYQ